MSVRSSRDVCFLDARSRLLFSGDVLYPGYLYVRDIDKYAEGIRNLYEKVRGRFDFSLGAHVEMNRDGKLFESGVRYQPNEMPLQQRPEALHALFQLLQQKPHPINKYFALFPKANL